MDLRQGLCRARAPTDGAGWLQAAPPIPFLPHRYWLWFSKKWSPHLRQWHHSPRSCFVVWRRKPGIFPTFRWTPCFGAALEGSTRPPPVSPPVDDCHSLILLPKNNPRPSLFPSCQTSPSGPQSQLWNPSPQTHLQAPGPPEPTSQPPEPLEPKPRLSASPPAPDSPSRLQPLPTVLPSIHQLHPASPRGSSLIVLSHRLGLPAGKVSFHPLGPAFPLLPPPKMTVPSPPSRLQSCSFQRPPVFVRTFCFSRTSRVSGAGICSA